MPLSWRRRIAGPNPRRTLIRAAVMIALAAVTFTWILLPVRAEGVSMLPTVRPGFHLVNRLAFSFREPQRGELVAVRFAGVRVVYLKRIVALPGQRVAFDGGRLLVDGIAVDEPYVQLRSVWNLAETTLQADEYYVVGDNRSMPAGQHDFGRVERRRIAGSVLF